MTMTQTIQPKKGHQIDVFCNYIIELLRTCASCH
jgi:hypothetical protein